MSPWIFYPSFAPLPQAEGGSEAAGLSLWLILLLIFVLNLGNAVFAATEIAVVSARKGRLQQRADDGDEGARAALQLQEDPNRFLSTTQVGITLINFISGVFAGDQLGTEVARLLAGFPLLAPYAAALTFVIVVLGLSYATLIIGELVPKRLAMLNPESLAVFMARPMQLIELLTRPFVLILSWSTNLVLALLGQGNASAQVVTEEDIRQLVREGTEGGQLEAQEEQLINRIFRFTDRHVHQIMTPRVNVVAIDADEPVAEAIAHVLESGYSRFPVYRDELDHVIGTVLAKDLLNLYRTDGSDAQIDSIIRLAMFVPESARAANLLAEFRKNQQHMAIVINEHGATEGVVTLEDVLEEIVGEIADEYDEAGEPGIVRREDGSLLIDGVLPTDTLKQRLSLRELPGEEFFRYDTLAGFMLSQFGRIPQPGDSFVWNNLGFEVLDMDGLRIDKVLVRQVNLESSTPAKA